MGIKQLFLKKIQDKRENVLEYKDIAEIPIGEEIDYSTKVDKSITSTRLPDTSTGLSFRVFMKKGTKFEAHSHDCEEIIIVYKGRLRGLYNNIMIGRGSIIEIPRGSVHKIYAEEDSEFYVEFKKPLTSNDNMDNR